MDFGLLCGSRLLAWRLAVGELKWQDEAMSQGSEISFSCQMYMIPVPLGENKTRQCLSGNKGIKIRVKG